MYLFEFGVVNLFQTESTCIKKSLCILIMCMFTRKIAIVQCSVMRIDVNHKIKRQYNYTWYISSV